MKRRANTRAFTPIASRPRESIENSRLAGIAPEKAIKLGVNDNLQTIFTTQIGSFPLWAQVVAGCCAGLCQVVVTSPIEVIKMTLQLSNATSVRDAYEKVGGVPGLFRGSQACVVRDVLWTAVCFPLYHCWSQVMPALLAGGASGMLASGLATPPDFVKTRMVAQYAQQVPRLVEDLEEIIDSPLLLAQKIAKEDGPRAFFGGVTERMACAAPRFGVTLAMHDFLEQTFAQAGWFS